MLDQCCHLQAEPDPTQLTTRLPPKVNLLKLEACLVPSLVLNISDDCLVSNDDDANTYNTNNTNNSNNNDNGNLLQCKASFTNNQDACLSSLVPRACPRCCREDTIFVTRIIKIMFSYSALIKIMCSYSALTIMLRSYSALI